MEEWRNPALNLRRDYPEPEYVGGKRKRGAENAGTRGAVQRRKKKEKEKNNS